MVHHLWIIKDTVYTSKIGQVVRMWGWLDKPIESLHFEIIGAQDHNRRYKLILEIGLSKGFAPARLIISIFHRLIGQNFESGILFISLANLHGGKRWLDVWERGRQAPLYSKQSPRWVYNAYYDRAYLYKVESEHQIRAHNGVGDNSRRKDF